MHEGCREDHLESHSEEDSEENTSRSSVDPGSRSRVTRGDLVDDYEITWEDDSSEDQGIEIQEATGGQISGRGRKLEVYYDKVCEIVDQEGELKIEDQTHVGSTRGGHIITKFKQAVRRIPDDDLDNWELEGDGNYESYPKWIRRT